MMKKCPAVFASALLCAMLALAACSTDEALAPAPDARAMPPKIALDVQTITLADRSGLQPISSPYNHNHLSPTIAEAIRQWATDRLQAVGQGGQAIIVVKDASLIAQPLPIKEGMDGWFTRQQGSKYIGHAELSIEANGREGFATTDAVATRSVTLPEDPTPMEKQEAYYTLLNGLMKDLGQNLEAGIQSHMAPFILSAPVHGGNDMPMADNLPTAPAMDRPVAPVMQPSMPMNGAVATAPLSAPVMATPMGQNYGASTPGAQAMPTVTTLAPPSQPAATIPLSGTYGQ